MIFMSVIYLDFSYCKFFDYLVQLIDLGSKNLLQLAHSGYQDFWTKAWGGSLDFNIYTYTSPHPYILKATTPQPINHGLQLFFNQKIGTESKNEIY